MNELTQRRPAYYTGFENETFQFETVDELLELDWVKNFAKRDDFHRFSVASRNPDKYSRRTLMAEYQKGDEFWAIGFLKEDVPELASWRMPGGTKEDRRRRIEERENLKEDLEKLKDSPPPRKLQDEIMDAIRRVIGK